MTVASVDDVAVELGRLFDTAAETDQAQWWLDSAELVIAARLGSVANIDQDLLKLVEVLAVAAKVRRHGTAESSVTVSVDDGSVTRRYDNPLTSDDITDEWWDLLMGRQPTRGTSAVRWLA